MGKTALCVMFLTLAVGTGMAMSVQDAFLAPSLFTPDCSSDTHMTTFQTTDTAAWVAIHPIAFSSSDQVQVDFVKPDGTTYLHLDMISSQQTSGTGCYYQYLWIRGHAPESLTGGWKATVYANGSLLISLPFTIGSTSSINPSYLTLAFTGFSTTPVPPIAGQSFAFTAIGSGFDPSTATVVFTGTAACPDQQPYACAVHVDPNNPQKWNTSMTSISAGAVLAAGNYNVWIINNPGNSENRAGPLQLAVVQPAIISQSNNWIYNEALYGQSLHNFVVRLSKTKVSGTRFNYIAWVLLDQPGWNFTRVGSAPLQSADMTVITPTCVKVYRSSVNMQINHNLSGWQSIAQNPASNWEDLPSPSRVLQTLGVVATTISPVLGYLESGSELLDIWLPNTNGGVGPSDHFFAKESNDDYNVARFSVGPLQSLRAGITTPLVGGIKFSIDVDEQCGQPEFLITSSNRDGEVIGVEIGLDRQAIASRGTKPPVFP